MMKDLDYMFVVHLTFVCCLMTLQLVTLLDLIFLFGL